MHDNKVRLSHDVLEKAERIAAEWGLKNARAAVEAVFRRYCDDYLYGRPDLANRGVIAVSSQGSGHTSGQVTSSSLMGAMPSASSQIQCEALDALDQLLAL
ncbi:MAG: hypothetical protein HC929_23505 [Leptolyngbyaceae cyanobacterium SM2_5_2]|nr:hypothetical protein [Leptolyngbyaceae cyanobacterium SM2_5_2]